MYNWFGHVQRMGKSRITKRVFKGKSIEEKMMRELIQRSQRFIIRFKEFADARRYREEKSGRVYNRELRRFLYKKLFRRCKVD